MRSTHSLDEKSKKVHKPVSKTQKNTKVKRKGVKKNTIFYQEVADRFEDWSKYIDLCVPVTETNRSGNTGEISEIILKSLKDDQKKRMSFYGSVFDLDKSFKRT